MIQVGREENQAFPPSPLPFFPFPSPREGNQAFPFPSPSFFSLPLRKKIKPSPSLGEEHSLPLPSFPFPSSSLDFLRHQLDIIPPPPRGGNRELYTPLKFCFNVLRAREHGHLAANPAFQQFRVFCKTALVCTVYLSFTPSQT